MRNTLCLIIIYKLIANHTDKGLTNTYDIASLQGTIGCHLDASNVDASLTAGIPDEIFIRLDNELRVLSVNAFIAQPYVAGQASADSIASQVQLF